MKGLVFQQQLEIRLDVAGEEFHQGDSLSCTLSVKNRGTTAQRLGMPFLALALGDMKKVKAKAEDAFKIVTAAECSEIGELAPGAEHKLPWTFTLDINSPISDKSHSLCLVYGIEDAAGARGHLQLPVQPHPEIEGILLVFETSFQFVPKGQRSKGGWVYAKLKPPSGRRFLTVEELELGFHFAEEMLQLRYNFKVKKLEASATTLEVQKRKTEYTQDLPRQSYFSTAGYIDSKALEPKIEEILSQVGSKLAR